MTLTERQRVEDMLGSVSDEIPNGTEQFRITLNTLATEVCVSAV